MPQIQCTLDWTIGVRPPDAERQHRISVRALVADPDGRILLVETADGHLMLPGGGIEGDESEDDCLRREVAEETGVVIDSVLGHVGTCTEVNPDRDGTSIWVLECRYLMATTNGETVAVELTDQERASGIHPVWLAPEEAMRTLVEQIPASGRAGHWALRELPMIATWHAQAGAAGSMW